MAFVARTTRDTNKIGFTIPGTTHEVGPGSYDMQSSIRRPGPAHAPFSTTANRSEIAAQNSAYTPGPGSYVTNSNSNAFRARSEAPFLSYSDRFRPTTAAAGPGPGAYSVTKPSVPQKRRPQTSSKLQSRDNGVTWVRVPTAPSIPTRAQSFGYEDGQYGELVMSKPDNAGYSGRGADTVGPGGYEPAVAALSRMRRSGATPWGRDRGQRTDFTKLAGSGDPGAYQNESKQSAQRASAPFASRVKRLQSAQSTSSKPKYEAPGPGQYSVPSAFRTQAPPARHQYFGSTSKRFSATETASAPGPGQYSKPLVSRTSRSLSRSLPGRRDVAFSTGGPRWRQSIAVDGPGVGAYNLPTISDEIAKKAAESGVGVFGGNSKRFQNAKHSGAPENLGPGAYEPTVQASMRNAIMQQKPSSMFSSGADRFGPLKLVDNATPGMDAPPPGSYDVGGQWSVATFNRALHKTGTFGRGGAGRFKPAQESAPGPGAYPAAAEALSIAKTTSPQRRFTDLPPGLSAAPRFGGPDSAMAAASDTPGPGAYEGDNPFTTLRKRTYNMSIAEEEALAPVY